MTLKFIYFYQKYLRIYLSLRITKKFSLNKLNYKHNNNNITLTELLSKENQEK